MTMSPKCTICLNADRRRAIELMWNGGMSCPAISLVLGGTPSQGIILKHLKEHSDGSGAIRQVEVEPELPARERVLALQTLQLDEVWRRIEIAKTRAAAMNKERENMTDAEGNPFPEVDWSDFYDILSKDAQAAISSILKTQSLADRRDKTQGELKLGLFEAMTAAGMAPKGISGPEPKQIPAPIENPLEGEGPDNTAAGHEHWDD